MLFALAMLLLGSLAASAQQQPLPFTYVSEWTIPRAQWDDYENFIKKNTQPILEKLTADGTISGWGFYATNVHDESGVTHGDWFEASSIANIQKALTALTKAARNPILSASGKHRDYLVRSQVRRGKPASGTDGFLWVNYTQLKPGKNEEWRALFDKSIKPLLDGLVDDGSFISYSIDAEVVHTDNPNGIYLVYMAPNAAGIDKFIAAVGARMAQATPEERRAFGEAFAATTEPGAHRDFFARILNYAEK
jgi:hypothetical protein